MKKPKIGVVGLGGQSAFMSAVDFPMPGETISCNSLFFELGGKGYNQALVCANMGIETVFVGAVGEDTYGEACKQELEEAGITTCLIKKKLSTAFAVITTSASGENTVQVFPGAAKELSAEDMRSETVQGLLQDCDFLLLQNELSKQCLEASFELAEKYNIPVVFNPAPADSIPAELLRRSYLVTPNFGEAKTLAGFDEQQDVDEKTILQVFQNMGITKAIITLGEKGAIIMDEEEIYQIPAFSCGTVVDTTGAGDTFNGALTAALAMQYPLKDAARIAAVAAGISITRHGAAGSAPNKDEVFSMLEA